MWLQNKMTQQLYKLICNEEYICEKNQQTEKPSNKLIVGKLNYKNAKYCLLEK